jgi:hypothetical protein
MHAGEAYQGTLVTLVSCHTIPLAKAIPLSAIRIEIRGDGNGGLCVTSYSAFE